MLMGMQASQMAKALGRRGGLARSRRLARTDKQRIAALGGRARSQSLLASRRIADNFRYVVVREALRPRPASRRLSTFTGRLPGIYPGKP
jgi:hypothetical protein